MTDIATPAAVKALEDRVLRQINRARSGNSPEDARKAMDGVRQLARMAETSAGTLAYLAPVLQQMREVRETM